MWNTKEYFEDINGKLKLTKGKYTFCRVTSIDNMEEVISNMTSSDAFTAVNDTDEGVTIKKGGGFFNRRTVVVFILRKFDTKSQTDRDAKMAEIKKIYRSFCSRLLVDKRSNDDMAYLDDNRFPYHEVPGMWVAGTCGFYFMITIDEPTSLVYEADEWE